MTVQYLDDSESHQCKAGEMSRGSSVSRIPAGRQRFKARKGQWWVSFSSPPHPDRLWDPPSPLSDGYQGRLHLG